MKKIKTFALMGVLALICAMNLKYAANYYGIVTSPKLDIQVEAQSTGTGNSLGTCCCEGCLTVSGTNTYECIDGYWWIEVEVACSQYCWIYPGKCHKIVSSYTDECGQTRYNCINTGNTTDLCFCY